MMIGFPSVFTIVCTEHACADFPRIETILKSEMI